ncbi:MAG TPA: phosphate ABC transporter permease PstA [Gaiellaceae bacterium]|nr:phosphate ABC transporter permease PstA [Gaiellaceae bacterium]
MSAADATQLGRRNDRLRRRHAVNRGMELLAWLAAAIAVAILGIVVVSVAKRGASQLNLDLFTKTPTATAFTLHPVAQGISNAFVGSLVIVGLATAFALPIGILIAIYVNEFAPGAVKNGIGLVLDVLNGVPAIVIGIFVFGLLVVGHGQSGIAGAFALAVIMLPLVARSTIEVLALVPNTLREAGLGLGVPRWRTTLGIVVPQAVGGIVTGAVLAIARIAGETAPLILVSSIAGSSVAWNPIHALQTVPVAIFQLSEEPDPQAHARAWAAALVLVLFVLVVSLVARWFATRSRRKLQGAR